MRVNNYVLFNAATMGGTTAVTSQIISLEHNYTYAYQYTAAGTTASGSIQVQGSCDMGNNAQGDGVTNWANIDAAVSVSALGTIIVNKDAVGWKWFRMIYTPASGAGTLTVVINTKGN